MATSKTYPKLAALITEMEMDNDHEWPNWAVTATPALEAMAAKLTPAQLDLLATGEAEEINQLSIRLDVVDLHIWMDEVFNGAGDGDARPGSDFG